MKLAFKYLVASLILFQLGAPLTSFAQHNHASGTLAKASALKVQSFDETTWANLIKQGPRPVAYLFTTSYCSTCPEAFEVLNNAVKKNGKKIDLVAVMMDVSGAQALRHANHFNGLTQLYSFDGFEPAIRQSVDPQWPNVTPYIVLIDRHGGLQKTIGQPSASMLKRWLL
jgi:thiol-disulfide isomerase/thioredoxin